jgi:two-component system sensor histidine kinase KdpD
MADSTDEIERLRKRYERERRIRQEAEAIAERATARLYETDRLKSTFLRTISHELRTPLTAITGFSDLVVRHWDALDDARRLDFMERIRRNSTVLRTLIEELLDLTRLDREGPIPTQAPVSLSQLVSEVVGDLADILSKHTVRLDLDPDVTALADPLSVARVVSNLLVNAVRYAPEGTMVDIAAFARDECAVLVVADEGPGIPPEERGFVFERFFRGEHDAVLRTQGTGIGLAVVKELTGRMGGRVELDDADGGGARFSVYLPCSPALNR